MQFCNSPTVLTILPSRTISEIQRLIPLLYLRPPLGRPRPNFVEIRSRKTRIMGLYGSEELNDMLSRPSFHIIHNQRVTDRRTNEITISVSRVAFITRDKNRTNPTHRPRGSAIRYSRISVRWHNFTWWSVQLFTVRLISRKYYQIRLPD